MPTIGTKVQFSNPDARSAITNLLMEPVQEPFVVVGLAPRHGLVKVEINNRCMHLLAEYLKPAPVAA